ncbi:hypothetical protein G210_1876, partial [Candida maltosa Xu316]
ESSSSSNAPLASETESSFAKVSTTVDGESLVSGLSTSYTESTRTTTSLWSSSINYESHGIDSTSSESTESWDVSLGGQSGVAESGIGSQSITPTTTLYTSEYVTTYPDGEISTTSGKIVVATDSTDSTEVETISHCEENQCNEATSGQEINTSTTSTDKVGQATSASAITTTKGNEQSSVGIHSTRSSQQGTIETSDAISSSQPSTTSTVSQGFAHTVSPDNSSRTTLVGSVTQQTTPSDIAQANESSPVGSTLTSITTSGPLPSTTPVIVIPNANSSNSLRVSLFALFVS